MLARYRSVPCMPDKEGVPASSKRAARPQFVLARMGNQDKRKKLHVEISKRQDPNPKLLPFLYIIYAFQSTLCVRRRNSSKMDSADVVDRKTFFLGIFLAVAVILFGYYALNRVLLKESIEGPQPLRQAPSAPHLAQALETSPFVEDANTDASALKAISASGRSKVILVHAPWCGHCRNMMAAFVQAASIEKSVDWIRVDGNTAPALVSRSDLHGFPTIYGVDANGAISQHSGARDVASLVNFAKNISREVLQMDKHAAAVTEPIEEDVNES